ncbi:uncharacterized protein LOC103928604 [Pyrus x bretschneideri]|uniref:uncharacterized protein LOC103928604 n=1 Tax=Pyrus x bretschneideri TaxID=225117 RepID=UPI002030E6C5|nr:uncharacterized protein LOC103928604 [Pyrus x bretschneideri]
MAWRSAGSLSRSLVSTARVSSLRLAAPLPRLRPPSLSTPRRLFASPREEWKRWVVRKDFQSSKGRRMINCCRNLKGLLDHHS